MMEQLHKALYMHGWVKFSQTPELYSLLIELCSHIAAILATVMKAVNSRKKYLELMPALCEVASCKKS